ncbi:MAG: dTDP-4-dehydrorhamnose reductase [Flavobacteriaceae bacterium]|nr:dTDP-4-dehydrorhamnose reductase [Flavobacteriaceae bacterium]
MTNVLVTGADGQLSSCLEDISLSYPDLKFVYKTIDQLDITSPEQIKQSFAERDYSYCVNCAAYTAVDQAEANTEMAFKVNAAGAAFLSEQCKKSGTVLIQISTDFVFDGNQDQPYQESDYPNPLGVYGSSKLQGEIEVMDIMDRYYIIRTSWLYSEHGHNFMKTMLRLASEMDTLSIVNDQIGTPTYAGDLAKAIIQIIKSNKDQFGIYHFSNYGETSWFEFAKTIFKTSGIKITVDPIVSEEYKTAAQRPAYSVLNTNKIKKTFPEIEIKPWQDSLVHALINVQMNTNLQTAIKASIEAGKAIMEVYNSEFAIEYKDDKSPLTLADKNANDIINKHLQDTPIPVISEENKQIDFSNRKSWNTCWVVDPVDGTKEFIKRNGEFTVNIALVEEGKPHLGVIYVPATKVLYYANTVDNTAFKVKLDDHEADLSFIIKNSSPLKPKEKNQLTQVVGSRSHMNEETQQFIKELESKGEQVEIVSKGSSLKFCLVAEGQADVYPRFAPTMEWDTAAGQAICNAVGIEVINQETNQPLQYNKENLLNPWFLVTKH